MTSAGERGTGSAAATPVHVLVGVLTDSGGRVLIAQRPAGKHMAGAWELPGGKRHAGEARRAALCRELEEELDVRVIRASPFVDLVHEYADRHVRLDVWWVEEFSGCARPREGQALRWVEPDGLAQTPILPADLPIVAAIRAKLGR